MTHLHARRRGIGLTFIGFALLTSVGAARADVDANGPWGITFTQGPGIIGLSTIFDVTQVGSALTISSSDLLIGPISATGSIDPGTGQFSASGTANPIYCPTLTPTGVATADDALTGTFLCDNGLPGAYVGSRCGNGVLDFGEECENVDCCDVGCVWKPAGWGCNSDGDSCTWDVCDAGHVCTHPLAPAGDPCDGDGNQCTDDICDGAGVCTHPNDDTNECIDGNDCTDNDVCSAGVCAGVNSAVGSPCGADQSLCTKDTCDGAGTCIQGPCSPCCTQFWGCFEDPFPNCKKPTLPKSQIDLRSMGDSGDKLKWHWKLGEQTDVAEFGNPLGSTGYTFCVYGNYVSSLLLQHDAHVPGGGTCDGSPCWKAKDDGFTYKDKAGTADGIESIKLKAGADGEARIFVKGSGANLNVDPLFFLTEEGPTVTQLRANNGECWEAEFVLPKKKNQAQFKAKDGQ